MKFFKEHQVTRVIMAGRVQHSSIFKNLMPDLRGAKFLASLKSMQAKHILSRVIEEFKKDVENKVRVCEILKKYKITKPTYYRYRENYGV